MVFILWCNSLWLLCSFWPPFLNTRKGGHIHGKNIQKMYRLIQCQCFDRTCDLEQEMNNNIVPTFYCLNYEHHNFICKKINILFFGSQVEINVIIMTKNWIVVLLYTTLNHNIFHVLRYGNVACLSSKAQTIAAGVKKMKISANPNNSKFSIWSIRKMYTYTLYFFPFTRKL